MNLIMLKKAVAGCVNCHINRKSRLTQRSKLEFFIRLTFKLTNIIKIVTTTKHCEQVESKYLVCSLHTGNTVKTHHYIILKICKKIIADMDKCLQFKILIQNLIDEMKHTVTES